MKVFVVSPASDVNAENVRISECLGVDGDKVVFENKTTKEFFEDDISLSYFSGLSGAGDDDPF